MPEPRIGFLQEALRWWDHWLKGEPTGVARDPALPLSMCMDADKPGELQEHLARPLDRPTASGAGQYVDSSNGHLNADGIGGAAGRGEGA